MAARSIRRQSVFQEIPGVGPNLARDFEDLGYHKVADLTAADPEEMYERLGELRGAHVDRCVLYVFRCAAYYARESRPQPHLLKWWNWKDGAAGPSPK